MILCMNMCILISLFSFGFCSFFSSISFIINNFFSLCSCGCCFFGFHFGLILFDSFGIEPESETALSAIESIIMGRHVHIIVFALNAQFPVSDNFSAVDLVEFQSGQFLLSVFVFVFLFGGVVLLLALLSSQEFHLQKHVAILAQLIDRAQN